MRITYLGLPPEVEAAITPHVERWAIVLPGWMERLYVVTADDEDNNALSCTVRPEYLAMTLFVHPTWLTQDAEKRGSDVLHEFVHAPLERAHDVFVNVMKSAVDDTSPLYDWAHEEYRKGMESAVCDLTHALLRMSAECICGGGENVVGSVGAGIRSDEIGDEDMLWHAHAVRQMVERARAEAIETDSTVAT